MKIEVELTQKEVKLFLKTWSAGYQSVIEAEGLPTTVPHEECYQYRKLSRVDDKVLSEINRKGENDD